MALKEPEIEVNAKECVKHLQCTITIKGWKRFVWRTKTAIFFLCLISYILPIDIKIETKQDEEK